MESENVSEYLTNLSRANVRHRGRQLAPLHDDVLGDLAVRVHVNSLVIVTQQQLRAITLGQHHNCMWYQWRA